MNIVPSAADVFAEHARVAERARELLEQVGGVLERAGERDWLPGVRTALGTLVPDPADSSWTPQRGLTDASSIYRAMTRGPGSFADLCIHHADPAEQLRENTRLATLADELWRLLGDVR